MEAETNIDNEDIKIEMDIMGLDEDIDAFILDEEIDGWKLEESELIDTIEDDPLLTLTPIVVTTKLDEMRTINKNLTDLNANEIIEMLHKESKPNFNPYTKTRKVGYSVHLESFANISTVIHSVNFKSRLKDHTTYVRNLKLWNQCKQCSVKLIDFRKIPPKRNTAIAVPIASENKPFAPSTSQVKVESKIHNDDEVSEGEIKIEVVDLSDSEIEAPTTTVKSVTNVIEEMQKKQSETKKPTILANKSKKNVPHSKTTDTTSSAKKLKTISTLQKENGKNTKSKASRLIFESSDEETERVPLKKKPVAVVSNPTSVVVTQSLYQEKYGLIVLLKTNKKEACVYRVNTSKLVTDYYITSDYDEYKVASMFPKEEKIVEDYCCWQKREEVVSKICARKNYPFTIQKFLRTPHSCRPEHCQCCCFNNHAGKSKEPPKIKHTLVNKSIDLAHCWIRNLLERSQSSNIGLVAKALNYNDNLKAKPKENVKPPETDSFLEKSLLWLYYTGNIKDAFTNTAELYVIGINGQPIAKFLFNEKSDEEANRIRQSYESLDFGTIEMKFCCWYFREKMLLNMRNTTKILPTVFKLIKLSHSCLKHNCRCCCRPDNILQLKADIDVLPSTLKYTTTYEKDLHSLDIRFNVKSKFPISNTKLTNSKTPNTNNASKPAAVLADCARKKNKKELSISILNKFKTLKLGLTSDGDLEAILDTHARNLSLADLKLLSDIFALSRQLITELGLTVEEFCNRINNKSGESNTQEVNKTSKVSQISSDTLEKDIVTPAVMSTNATDSDTSKIAMGIRQNNVPPIKETTLLNESTAPHTIKKSKNFKFHNVTSKNYNHNVGVLVSNVCTSLSNLMKKKNKYYVDSFKGFFKNTETSVVTMPEISNKFRSIAMHGRTVEEQIPSSLPKITETFTLAKSRDDAIAGPSRLTKPIEKVTVCSTHAAGSATQTVSNQALAARIPSLKTYSKGNKRKVNTDTDTTNKRIRVKNPSELLHVNTSQVNVITTDVPLATAQVPITTNVTNPISMWPVPFKIKQDQHIRLPQIGIPQQPIAIQINPSINPIQSPTYFIGNNVVNTPGIQIVNASNLFKVNANNIVTTTSALSNVNTGSRFMTLTPIQAGSVNNVNSLNTVDNSMLAQILKTRQVQPFKGSAGNSVPPLVPFGSPHVQQGAGMPMLTKKENSGT